MERAHYQRKTTPRQSRDSRMPSIPTNGHLETETRSLGGLRTLHPLTVEVAAAKDSRFSHRVNKEHQRLTPQDQLPFVRASVDGNGTIGGGKSKEARRKARRAARRQNPVQ